MKVLLTPVKMTGTDEARYGIGLEDETLVILSHCCARRVHWDTGSPREVGVVCNHCGKGYPGFSDNEHALPYDNTDETPVRWISAWTGIPESDIEIRIDES